MIQILTEDDHFNGEGEARKIVLYGPPGTGKTRAAVDGYVIPALNQGVMASRVLCCSFSRAAAYELRDRVAKMTSIRREELRTVCSTIHAEAFRAVKRVNPSLGIYDGEARKIIGKGAKEEPEPDQYVGTADTRGLRAEALRWWSFARNVKMSEDEWEKSAKSFSREFSGGEIIDEAQRYEKEKEEAGGIDFTDMLSIASERYNRELDLLVVDEAQDCSPLQWEVVNRWKRHARWVVIIGDPDQAIHEWNGARPELFRALQREGFEPRRLGKSYRVPSETHRVAMRIIRTTDRDEVEYAPKESKGYYLTTVTVPIIADAVTREDRTCFVLARTAAILSDYADLLADKGIPFEQERGIGCIWKKRKLCLAVAAIIQWGKSKTCSGETAKALVDLLPAASMNCRKVDARERLKAVPSDESTSWLPFDDVALDLLGEAKGIKWKHVTSANEIAKRYGVDALIDRPKIILTTFHGSKGREADVVIISPEKPYRVQKEYHHDQEMRCLYVAITRAKEAVFIDVGKVAGGASVYPELIQGA